MAMRAAEKLIEALTLFVEGFALLQESVESDYGSREEEAFDEEGESELSLEIDAAIVTEMRAAIETVMETEDLSAEEFATAISTLSEALEEIDPDVFETEETEDAYESDEDVEYEDDDEDYGEIDDDDDDEEYYEEDEEEDDEEYEDDEEE